MGLVYASIKLINDRDTGRFEDGLIPKEQIRQLQVDALVDSGAYMLVINQNIQTQLGLKKKKTQSAQLADGSVIQMDIVGPIEVLFENRSATCNAMVIPGDNEVLLGAIPMEEMDVLIHPKENKLIVNPSHPYQAMVKLK
jgi:clan AA aspartic protease